MRERPILFSGPMVRALLDGRKTQTRRVVKSQPVKLTPEGKYEPHDPFKHEDGVTWGWMCGVVSYTQNDVRCPYGVPGDRLWVRETFITGYDTDGNGNLLAWDAEGDALPEKVWYRATDRVDEWLTPESDFPTERVPWKPSIHMPRLASRLTLELTGVRVERVQDISEADARAEGFSANDIVTVKGNMGPFACEVTGDAGSARRSFFNTFFALNTGRVPADANPWVWVLDFTPITQPDVAPLASKTSGGSGEGEQPRNTAGRRPQ